MVSVFDVRDVSTALGFVAWLFAVLGLSRAIFGSFVAAELHFWLARREQQQNNELARLKWELKHGIEWSEEVAANLKSPNLVKKPLDESGREWRRKRLDQEMRGSRVKRAVAFGLACPFCHASTAAALLFGLTAGWHAGELIVSTLAYGAAAALVIERRKTAPVKEHGTPKSCGH